jgi:hypothetical protein
MQMRRYRWKADMRWRIVHVNWYDASSRDEWHNVGAASVREIEDCHTVGLLVEITKDYIRVANTVGNNESMCCVIAIPCGAVRKIEELGKL